MTYARVKPEHRSKQELVSRAKDVPGEIHWIKTHDTVASQPKASERTRVSWCGLETRVHGISRTTWKGTYNIRHVTCEDCKNYKEVEEGDARGEGNEPT